jgi:outer membrane protein assembly factor BamB
MIVTFGISGTLSCLDASSGDLKWRKNDFPGSLPRFNTAMSPVIVDGLCIGQFGGQEGGAVVAYELSTGNQKWKWDSPGATHSSPNLMTVGDTKIAVVMIANSVVGINIADGALLWEIPFEAGRNRQCVTPIVDGQKVICCGGQGQGMKAVEIKKEGEKFTVNDLWTYSDNYVEYNTPILKDGFVFAVSNQDEYFCVNADTGQEAWINKPETAFLNNISNSNVTAVFAAMGGGRGGAMGRGRGGRGGMGGRGGRGGGGMGSTEGYGTIVDAGSVLIGLIASGQLTVLEPDGKEYKELAGYKVGDGPIYAYPVISGNRIYIMDQTSISLWTIE